MRLFLTICGAIVANLTTTFGASYLMVEVVWPRKLEWWTFPAHLWFVVVVVGTYAASIHAICKLIAMRKTK